MTHQSFPTGLAARLAVAIALLTTLAACGTAPLSFINDRQVTYRAVLYRVPLFVDAVDGQSTSFRPVPISPGQHLVTMHAPPVAGFSLSVNKTIPMFIEPCTRYDIAAQRPSLFSQDWELVVERTYPVGACDKDQELQKTRTVASSSSGTSTIVARGVTQ